MAHECMIRAIALTVWLVTLDRYEKKYEFYIIIRNTFIHVCVNNLCFYDYFFPLLNVY